MRRISPVRLRRRSHGSRTLVEALDLLFLLKLQLLLLLLRLVTNPWRSLLGSRLLVLLRLECLGVRRAPIVECLVQRCRLGEVYAEGFLAASWASLDGFLTLSHLTRLLEPLMLTCDDYFVVEAVRFPVLSSRRAKFVLMLLLTGYLVEHRACSCVASGSTARDELLLLLLLEEGGFD